MYSVCSIQMLKHSNYFIDRIIMRMFDVQTAGEFFKLFAFYNQISCVDNFHVFKDIFTLVSIILFFCNYMPF